MPQPAHATLDEWIAREALPFALDAPAALHAAIDALAASLDRAVELLGFGEALHGGEDILALRNRLFERLADAHGFSAIAIESSFPLGLTVNEYVAGRGPATYEEVQERGFSPGFGRLEANRELVEWMRRRNADPARPLKLQFYGFDIPSSPSGIASPRQVLMFAVEYLAALDGPAGQAHRQRVEPLLGQDFDWENPAIYADPSVSVGLTPAASALRLATEDLIDELRTRRPELIALSDAARHAEALQYAVVARQLLSYHAAHAGRAGFGPLLGLRDALMADNLAYIAAREHGRGRVLVFAHNSHIQLGQVVAPEDWRRALGAEPFAWWPAGAHLAHMLGPRYATVGSALGVSEANGIGQPEPGTLEARLTAAPGPVRLIPTRRGSGLPAEEIAALPARTGSLKNLSYVALSPQSLANFDWLAVLDTATYSRGGPPLPQQG